MSIFTTAHNGGSAIMCQKLESNQVQRCKIWRITQLIHNDTAIEQCSDCRGARWSEPAQRSIAAPALINIKGIW
jgi:hypothetical protein